MVTITDINSLSFLSEKDKECVWSSIQFGHPITARTNDWMKNNKIAWCCDKKTIKNYSGFLFVFSESSLYHFKDGKIHQDDDKPAVVTETNEKFWYQNNALHRVNNPAIIELGFEHWYLNGKRHRIGGPSFYGQGYKPKWYVDNLEYDEEEYWRLPQLIEHKLNSIVGE